MIQAEVIIAGPRGNKCHGCSTKVKAPELLLRVTGEYNKYGGFAPVQNFCSECGKKELGKGRSKLEDLTKLLENGPTEDLQPRGIKVRSV